MAARTGAEYIKGLQSQECEVWLRGERVKDVTTHPGLANGVRAVALHRSRTASGNFKLEEGTALQVVRETEAGIVVRGARILAGLMLAMLPYRWLEASLPPNVLSWPLPEMM